MTNEICEINCIHEDRVNRAKAKLTDFDTRSVTGFFKILSDENRLKIVHALVHEDELCVCDIHKDGKLVYYFIKNIKILNLMELGVNFKEEVLA